MVAVTKPAPDWNGTAVLDGEFIEMKLSDFRGTYVGVNWLARGDQIINYLTSTCYRKIFGVFLLSA